MRASSRFKSYFDDIINPIFEAINNTPALLLKSLRKKSSSIKAEEIRKQRDALMAGADIAVNQAADQGNTKAEARARAYRQSLRDITKQPGFPFEVNWPEL